MNVIDTSVQIVDTQIGNSGKCESIRNEAIIIKITFINEGCNTSLHAYELRGTPADLRLTVTQSNWVTQQLTQRIQNQEQNLSFFKHQ